MKPVVLFALAAAFVPAAASAQGQGDVSVTIYNNNLALVQDIRQVALPTGRSRQEFPEVSAQIRPETVTIGGSGIAIVEQNFDYDLLSPDALMENAVGELVTIVRFNPATGQETRERARVLAVNGGVVLEIAGRIEVLRDDGRPARVVFDTIPPNLRARPTLSVTLDSNRAGTRPLSLSYLTPGLGWNADYVALYDQEDGTIDVQGWITLRNTTGTTFDNADTLLVAGAVNQGGNNNSRYRGPPQSSPITRPGTETADREQLGDFYLYPLGHRTTIADRQTKQVNFLDVQGARASNDYAFRVDSLRTADAASANSVLRFSSSSEGGLGDALPAGTVRVYMRDARGDPQFIGENAIPHTPMGSQLAIVTGEAFDVNVASTVVQRTRLAMYHWRTQMRYTLTNARSEAVTVQLDQMQLPWWWPETRVTEESLQSERLSADGVRWLVDVPANGETIVSATFDTRY
ncbi:DUF4139 domain-containing protein [Parasphingopyxis marina]|uniref:DUF4139 domain-containing protein n=1 Tax=Parasphingopyxis marina TaxID=2761622 RepID=A0A842HX35_9SPHN|nr:DUF4139 domain-containing protein [Parasphingopyxis marina]MBC2776074.1 DUF4139 domain-containing protein [Parasphingopyxis marina]